MGKLFWIILVACFLLGTKHSPILAQGKLDPFALAARIDQEIEAKWKGIEPAGIADDAEFLRRVSFDLAGRIPRVNEVRDFLEDSQSDRRQRIVEQYLASPQYVNHFSNTLLALFIPADGNQQVAANSFKPWLDEQVRNNTPYNKIVRDMLAAPLPANGNRNSRAARRGSSPVGFLLANEGKPENLAASASRIFLGVKLECAQCHDHPFARWSRSQFWEMAAFFTADQVEPGQTIDIEPTPKKPRPITIPGTEKMVSAKFLTGKIPDWEKDGEPRTALAEWIIASDNPYFARTMVNRLWAHFFGVGLIDPVDDEPTEENPISHPELLKELTVQFVAHDFDVKYLIRAITATRAYQRTSSQSHPSQANPRAFARMAVRGLTSQQLFESVVLATGFRDGPSNPQENPDGSRGEFLVRFASQERATEKQTSILQALALMNGAFVADATSLERGTTLAAIVDAPFLPPTQKIETLYLATLSRLPRPQETQRLMAYVAQGGSGGDSRRAYGDVFWALLNSSEFILNH